MTGNPDHDHYFRIDMNTDLEFIGRLVYCVIFVVGMVITWVLASWKSSSEIRKLNADKDKLEIEMTKLAGDNLYRLQEARSAYDDAMALCSKAASELVNLLRAHATIDSVRGQREIFCSAFSHQAVPKYLSYVEWEVLDRKNDSEQILGFAKRHLLPELKRLAEWLSIINLPVFTELGRMEPLKLQERSVEPFLKIMMYLPRSGNEDLRIELESAIDAIVE